MMARFWTIWESVRGSLWALPLAMTIGGVVLAVLALQLQLDVGSDPVWWLYSGSAKDAPEFLASLVSSMYTMGTLAISITMVVLALAAQQLGPRLIRSFMSDWRTQAALGLFLATIVYLLLVLRALHGDLGRDGVPNLAVTTGTALVLVSTVTLVLFVHHLARSIVSDNIIERVGAALDRAARNLLPKEREPRSEAEPRNPPDGARALGCSRGGYVQAIDYDVLVAAAVKGNALIHLDVRPGHHVLAGSAYGRVSPAGACMPGLVEAVESAVLVGGERTAGQDLEFAARQLVEIAVRALSPGINDPFTAIAAVDRLAVSLSCIMRRGPAPSVWRDEAGAARVFGPTSTFEGIVDTAFNQIRQMAEDHPAVLIGMADKLVQLARQADEAQRPALERHFDLVLATGRRAIKEPSDLAALEERAAR